METLAACITIAFLKIKKKGMMPMANNTIIYIVNALKSAASFAVYTATVLITGDASAATALHNLKIEG